MLARDRQTNQFKKVYVKALDSMPVGTEVDFDGQTSDIPVGWEEVTNPDSYSTNEVKTNKVWIDGKPIYRKVLNLNLTSSPSSASENLSNLNIKTITHLEGISQSNPTTTNYTWDLTADKFRTYYNPINKFIYVEGGSQYPTVPCAIYIILEYTKTTD